MKVDARDAPRSRWSSHSWSSSSWSPSLKDDDIEEDGDDSGDGDDDDGDDAKQDDEGLPVGKANRPPSLRSGNARPSLSCRADASG